VRRAQTVALTAVVVVVTSGVTFTLGRMFGSDRGEEASETPPAPLSVPDIAFAGEVEGKPGIYTMKADGSDIELLTTETGRGIGPSWSPDGTKLAFASDRGDDLDIHVLDLATGEERQVTADPSDDIEPAWSPDGTKLAFVSHRDGGSHIYLIDAHGDEAEGTEVTRLTFGDSSNVNPAWSTDGAQIYFSHDSLDSVQRADLYVLTLPSGQEGDPPPPAPLIAGRTGGVQQPAPSPDGAKLAFVSQPEGVSQIFVADAAGSDVRQVTHGPGHKTSPSWSPDGRRIVFSAGTGRNDLFVMNADGTGVRRITELPGNQVTPAWNPSAAAPSESDQGSESEPRCLSADEAAGEESLRRPGSLRGDVDGDGLDDEVFVAVDPQAAPTCRYFLIVETSQGTLASGIDLRGTPGEEDFPATQSAGETLDEFVGLQSLAEIDGQGGLEVFIDVWRGAAMEFGKIYTLGSGTLTPMEATGTDAPKDGVFSYAGSLSGVSALDCTEHPGLLVVSSAYPAEETETWIVDRRFFRPVDVKTFLLEPSGSEQHELTAEEIASGGLEERFPEFGEAPFDDCPGFVSAF
jgi:TolB protein